MNLTVGIITSTFLPSIGGSQIGLHVIAKSLSSLGHNIIIFVPFKTFFKLKKRKWSLNYIVLPLPPKLFGIYYRYSKIGIFIIKFYLNLINKFYKFDYWFANLAYPSGVMVSELAKQNIFRNNLVLCPGEDIQINDEISYGIRLNNYIDYKIRDKLYSLNHFVALTDSVRDEYLKLGIKREKILNIPYGIESTNLLNNSNKKEIRNLLNIEEKTFIFLCVGRNHPKKNFKLLINIAQELNKLTNQKYKILILGKEVQLLNKFIIEKKLQEYFILINEIDNEISTDLVFPSTKLSNYYKLSDCFIFPSNLETFGIVLVEAMMAGLPVITSDAPGCRDVVKNKEHGLVFKRGDYKSAAKLMFSIMSNIEIMKEYKNKSIKRSKKFESKNIALKYEEFFYKNLL